MDDHSGVRRRTIAALFGLNRVWTVKLRSRQRDDYSLGRRCLAAVLNVPLGPQRSAVPRANGPRIVEMPISALPRVRRNLVAAGVGVLLAALLGAVSVAAGTGVLPTPFSKEEPDPATSVQAYELVEDPAGFSLLVPAGWRRSADRERIVYTPEDSRSRLLRIDATNEPRTTPRLYLESVEENLSGEPGYHGFIIRTAGSSADSPAELLYVHDDAELGSQQVIVRSFRGPDRVRYTLSAEAPTDDWPDTFTLIDTASHSFCISGYPCIAPR